MREIRQGAVGTTGCHRSLRGIRVDRVCSREVDCYSSGRESFLKYNLLLHLQ